MSHLTEEKIEFLEQKANDIRVFKYVSALCLAMALFSPFVVEAAYFTRFLQKGSQGQEVINLQAALKSDVALYPEGMVTGYFGVLTEKAVQRFQTKHGIVSYGAPGTTGFGAVGPRTRAKLNELFLSPSNLPASPQKEKIAVNLKIDSSDGPITAAWNTAHTLSWIISGNPQECKASGQWSGLKHSTQGSEAVLIPSNVSGSLGWWLTCDGVTDWVAVKIEDGISGNKLPIPQPSPQVVPEVVDIQVTAVRPRLFTAETSQDLSAGLFNGQSLNVEKIARAFYQKYPDEYDFLAMYTPKNVTGYYAARVRNQEQGFGVSHMDIGASFGSKARLKGVAVVGRFVSNPFGALSLARAMTHEISHHWLIYVGDPIDCINKNNCTGKLRLGAGIEEYGHWNTFVDGTVELDGKKYGAVMKAGAWNENSDGSFSPRAIWQEEAENPRFNDIELYLMGFIPPEDVRSPLPFIEQSTPSTTPCFGTACKVWGVKRLVTVSDIIHMAGARVPAFPGTQRNFSVAQILVLDNGQKLSNEMQQRFLELEQALPNKWKEEVRGYATINGE